MQIFQTIILVVLGFALVIGTLIFAGILPGFRADNGGSGGAVVVWGTVPLEKWQDVLNKMRTDYREEFSVTYVAKSPLSFKADYIDALARGVGPDLIVLSDDLIVTLEDTLYQIPFESFSERDFRNTFIEGGEIYLTSKGILALPLSVDPLVLYYNRNLFTKVQIVSTPETWTEFIVDVAKLTEVDERRNIISSGTALGQFANIKNAKDILVMLFLQAGNPIVTRGENYQVTLHDSFDFAIPPAVAGVEFFNQFADQAKTTYSWSRAMPEALDAFSSEQLATYFGFASEYEVIKQKNPNLNFDVMVIPKRTNATLGLTRGRFEGLAVVKNSKNLTTAFKVAFIISGRTNAQVLAESLGLPSARRDLLALRPNNPIQSIFHDSALVSRTWYDPNPSKTKLIFSRLTETILLNREAVYQTIRGAHDELANLFKN